MANINNGFANIPIFKSEESSDRAFKALNISIVTSTDKLSVEAFYLPHEKYKHGSFEKSYLSKLAT